MKVSGTKKCPFACLDYLLVRLTGVVGGRRPIYSGRSKYRVGRAFAAGPRFKIRIPNEDLVKRTRLYYKRPVIVRFGVIGYLYEGRRILYDIPSGTGYFGDIG